jgi:hypothetical protein
LFISVAQLATVLDSGGDAELWQNIGLKQEPKNENSDQPPDTHVSIPTFAHVLDSVHLRRKNGSRR